MQELETYRNIIDTEKERISEGQYCTRTGIMMRYKLEFQLAQMVCKTAKEEFRVEYGFLPEPVLEPRK